MKRPVASGIAGLDYLLHGGFPAGASVLVEGAPGTGKTTLGMQFLYQGATVEKEAGIYLTFEELPEQIYEDMLAFGWDLRQLERDNLLRVICISPEILLEQMMQPDGLFEQIVRDMDCRRVVIDSISLMHDGQGAESRKNVYRIRNILRKLSLTSLLLREQANPEQMEITYEHYVMDGVIRLTLDKHMEKYRKRTLEITKMRGTRILEGEHIYRITDEGIHLIPALSMVEDRGLRKDVPVIPTGIPGLDELLCGGIASGTAFILDTNSKANYKYILGSIFAQRLLAGERTVSMVPSISTLFDSKRVTALFGVDLLEAVDQGKAYFLEHFERPVPRGFEKAVIQLSHVSDDEYHQYLNEKLGPIFSENSSKGESWFAFYDLNTMFSERGKSFVKRFFAEEVNRARSIGLTLVILCNFAEIDDETAALLERTCNGVIRTWVDGAYQYLQVTKSPHGRMSEPLLIENIAEKPFIRLI